MKFFFVFHARHVKQLSLIIVAAFFAAGILYVERSDLMVFSTPDGPQAFYKAEIDEKKVALTFNISWGEERLKPILNILEEKGVDHATFFISASWAERYPDHVKMIVEKGHSIGSHGYQYKNYTSWEDEEVRKDMNRSRQVIADITGERPTLLRPPNGLFDKRILTIAEASGYSIIHWSLDSKDYQNPGVDTIIETVVSNVQPGDVILFHASDSVKQTDRALPVIIDHLRKEGYSFSSVEDLIASTEASYEEIK